MTIVKQITGWVANQRLRKLVMTALAVISIIAAIQTPATLTIAAAVLAVWVLASLAINTRTN